MRIMSNMRRMSPLMIDCADYWLSGWGLDAIHMVSGVSRPAETELRSLQVGKLAETVFKERVFSAGDIQYK